MQGATESGGGGGGGDTDGNYTTDMWGIVQHMGHHAVWCVRLVVVVVLVVMVVRGNTVIRQLAVYIIN